MKFEGDVLMHSSELSLRYAIEKRKSKNSYQVIKLTVLKGYFAYSRKSIDHLKNYYN